MADTAFERVIDGETGNDVQQDHLEIEPMTCGRLLDDLLPDSSRLFGIAVGQARDDESEDELEIILLGVLDETAAGCEETSQPV
ncbi:hypothetical protein [Jhaorihella thermophila]|nr:hypothetical protein [Jhaorihella thermophila]